MKLIVDEEFLNLIPKLTQEEFSELAASVRREGCRDALVVWNGVLLDGHHRYAICSKEGIPFNVVERQFESREAAKEWIIRNQLGRRNLSDYMRVRLALQLKPILEQRGKQHMREGLSDLSNPHNTRAQLAALADVSQGSVAKVATVEAYAPPLLIEDARAGKVSIDRAYRLTKALGGLPETDRAAAARLCGDDVEKVEKLVDLYRSGQDESSNGTYDEIMSTGGFHYGEDMDAWCNYTTAAYTDIAAALRSLARHHAREESAERARVRCPVCKQWYTPGATHDHA